MFRRIYRLKSGITKAHVSIWRKQLQDHGDIPNKVCWQSKSNVKLTQVGQDLVWSDVAHHEYYPALTVAWCPRL